MKRLHDWETKPIAEVADIAGGSGFPTEFQGHCSGEVPFIKVSDLNLPGNERFVRHAQNWVSMEVQRKLKAKVHSAGSVVFAKVGGALFTNKRRILTQDTIIDNNMMSVKPRAVEPRYLFQLMLRIDLGRHRQEGAVPSVNGTQVGNITVDFPPIDEQKRIADILWTWDEALEKLDALIAAKERRKQALMQQLLTGTNRLSDLHKPWQRVRLSSLLKHVFRPVEWAGEKVFSLVSIRRRSSGLFRREEVVGADYKTTDLHEIKTGDFLISKRQVSHGALAMVRPEFDGCHVSKEYTIYVNKAPERLHMPFFDWLSRQRRMWWLAYVASNGVALEKLIFDPKDFLRFEITLPPTIEEQKRITEVLDDRDTELNLLRSQRDALDRQKRGLMQRLLTGKLRVKTV